jgi:outer membrane receptor protein involved in Fe transport
VVPDVRLDAAYSVSSQRYVSWTPQSNATYSGKMIEQAPNTLGNVVATYTPSVLHGGRLAAEWVSVGRYAMDPQNTHRYGGYRIVNMHMNYQVRTDAELFVRVMNLTNRIYAEVASYDPFQKELFSPGNPRSVYAGARYTLTR